MRRRSLIGVVLVLALMTVGLPASATIHEIVGAACNGKDFIDPEPLAFDMDGEIGLSGKIAPAGHPLEEFGTTARPVVATGAVAFGAPPLTTDIPAAKFKPGSDASALTTADLDHPSSDNCNNLQP